MFSSALKMSMCNGAGGDRKSLTLLYTALIRSKIDYGSFLYSTAAQTHLIKLDRVQYDAIRTIAGLLKCTSVDMLEAEANIVPLQYRREQLMLQYFTKILRIEDHPVTIAFNRLYPVHFFRHRPYALPVIGRAKILIRDAQLPIEKMEKITRTDLYMIGNADVRFNMRKYSKKQYTDDRIQQEFLILKNETYDDYVHCFTDGSRMSNKTSYAFIGPGITESNRLPSTCSVYTAEMYAIYRCIKYISNSHWRKAVIFSDSLSVLQSIQTFNVKSHYMTKLQELLAYCEKEIVLEWVPAHKGIEKNEAVDALAKEAINIETIRDVKLHYYDIKALIRIFTLQRWQSEWRLAKCWLQRLKPVILDWKSAYRESRREEIVLSRLRTGTPLFRFKHHFDANTPVDTCSVCKVRNSIYHLFLQCPQYTNYRTGIMDYLDSKNKSACVNNILDDEFPVELLFIFLKSINYYNKI